MLHVRCTTGAPEHTSTPRAQCEEARFALDAPLAQYRISHPLQHVVDISLDIANAHCLFRAIVILLPFGTNAMQKVLHSNPCCPHAPAFT